MILVNYFLGNMCDNFLRSIFATINSACEKDMVAEILYACSCVLVIYHNVKAKSDKVLPSRYSFECNCIILGLSHEYENIPKRNKLL
jgi:hypothetical protein